MLFSLLLATVLAMDPSPQQPSTGAAFAEALLAANDGRDAEALRAFQQLAAANPNDHAARMWIARLHVRMGRHDFAEPVYRSVLIEDPGNVDAMLGVAEALLARGEPTQAIEVLEVAEEARAPERRRACRAWPRPPCRRAVRTARSSTSSGRCQSSPTRTAPSCRSRGRDGRILHRVETRGSSEHFDGETPDGRSGDLSVNVRLNDTWRVFGRGQVQRKFAETEQRGGGGAEWRWKPTTILRGHALIGPGNVVMPEGDYLGEVQYTYQDATWTAGVRFFDFTGARTTVLSPSVAWIPTVSWIPEGRLSMALRYALSWTETAFLPIEPGHSFHVRAAYQFYPRVSVLGAYATGVEDFENFSIDRIGNFRANTLSGGLRIDLRTLTAIVGTYERQWQDSSPDVGRVTVGLLQSF